MELAPLLGRLRAAGPAPADDMTHPRAAVAAVLRPGADGAELLFIVRADNPRDPWSGHMAWPGGRHEPQDSNLLATAVRETREELGLDLEEQGSFVARLDDVPAFARGERTGLMIAPYVFALARRDVALTHQPTEVAESLWIPLALLARGEGAGTLDYDYKGTLLHMPCIRYHGRVLWGLTYQMLQLLLERGAG